MDELQAKHRREKKDLQAKITQKKKSASKKTRKGVNDECDRLETELQERQAQELSELDPKLSDESASDAEGEEDDASKPEAPSDSKKSPQSTSQPDISKDISGLTLSSDTPAAGGPKKPNRQKARLARRAADQARIAEEAAAEAESIPDLKAREREVITDVIQKRGLKEQEVRADGHCLYASVADQLHQRGDSVRVGSVIESPDEFRVVRNVAADFISKNSDDFVPFLEEDLDSYVHKVRDTGEWGGQIELLALSKAYNVKIRVIQGDGQITTVGDAPDDRTIWLAYYRHSFGLGEHYNSLRPASVSTK